MNGKLNFVLGSTGVLVPGMEARIIRDDGTDADINEPGELWLRGGNVALGYWNNEKASKETFVDGWVHTGDKFYVDSNANFWSVLLTFIFYARVVHSYMIRFFPSFRYADRAKVSFLGHSSIVSKNDANTVNIRNSGYSQSLRCSSIPCRN